MTVYPAMKAPLSAPQKIEDRRKTWFAAGGVIGAILASTCCIAPLVLLTLGIGGAWISNLTALEPLRPWFIAATLLFLGLAFRRLYLQPQVCEPGAACAEPFVLKRQRLIFWLVALGLLALLSVPWLAPFFL